MTRFAFLLVVCASLAAAAEIKLGKPLTLKSQTPIAELADHPAQFIGKPVQVKGQATEVCEKMGCWTNLKDPATGKMVRIKVKDGEIVFPKTAIGKNITAEGTFQKIELTKDQAIARAKHEAEEQGRAFDASKITGGTVIYQIQGTGAVLYE